MKFILLVSLILTSISAWSYPIREGGKTVGAGQVTEILSSLTGSSQEEVDTVLREVGRRLGHHLAFQTDVILDSLYLTTDGIDQDCDGIDNDCNRTDGGTKAQDYNSSRSNTTSLMLGDTDTDELILKKYLETSLTEFIQEVSLFANHNTTSSNRLAPLMNIGYSSWDTVNQKNPLAEAFKDPKKCVEFRESFIALVSEKMAAGKFEDTQIQMAKHLYDKALKSMEDRVKRHRTHRRRVEVLKSNSTVNQTEDVYSHVSSLTEVPLDKVKKITTNALSLIKRAMDSSQTIRVTGLGSFGTESRVKGPYRPAGENQDPGAPIGEVAIDSIFNKPNPKIVISAVELAAGTPSVWTPSLIMQKKKNNSNKRGICRYGRCFCSSSSGGEDGSTAKAKEKANKTKCSSAKRASETLNATHTAMQEAEEELARFYDKGNSAAGTRVRKTIQDLKSIPQDIRKEVQNMKNK